MPAKRRYRLSDTPSQRQLWERAAKREEELILLELQELLEQAPPPPRRRRRHKVGRPPKKPRGPREEFGWQSIVLVLLLKVYYYLTYREIASHLHANPELCRRLGMKRAPSHSTIQQAAKRTPESWWKNVNHSLVTDLKKGVRAVHRTSTRAWTAPAAPSKE